MVDIKEKLSEGWINSRVIIEVLGKPEEHVKNALKMYVDKIREDEEIIIVETDYSDPEPRESMFSAFVELEILTKDMMKLVWFCFDYLPSSVEIIEPENLKLKSQELSNFLNELQARLHKVGSEIKFASQANQVLTSNASSILRNFVRKCLEEKDMTAAELADTMDLNEDKIGPFLDIMVEKKIVEKKGENYSLVK